MNNLSNILNSKRIITLVVFTVIIVVCYNTVIFTRSLGLQEGYTPEQPIAFSHKLHAGEYQINCNYCHTGADEGKNALVPDVGTCMNCHSAIKKGALTGKTEIDKLQKAWKEHVPVKWVRVHNLPDHVYFNHQQHTVAAGLECQSCHGKVEEMETVQQVSSLSMGWCLDCHKKTEVKFKENNYYSSFKTLHDKLNKGEKKSVYVVDIGGLDCQKCHY